MGPQFNTEDCRQGPQDGAAGWTQNAKRAIVPESGSQLVVAGTDRPW
jgi:hypothetical protein